jgi:PAS domain-containing protein
MNTSIEGRIKFILGVSILLVVLMGGVTLYYFTAVKDNIENVIGADIKQVNAGQKLKSVYFDLKSEEKLFFHALKTGYVADPEQTAEERLKEDALRFIITIDDYRKQDIAKTVKLDLDLLYNDLTKYKAVIEEVESKKLNGESINYRATSKKLSKLRESQDKIINKILAASSQHFISNQNYLDHLISSANRNLVFLIMIALIAGALIIYLAPQKVTKPIRSYLNAIRELRDLRFETRLPIKDKNELSELGEEINAFIEAFMDFDEMKRKKIQFEKRKSQVLADIINLGVVTISIEGEVLFLNAQMAKILNLSTESFQKKDFHFVRLPDEIKDLFEAAIEKKEKFDNRMVILTYQKNDSNGESHEEAVELLVDAGMVRNYVGDVANIILTFEDISGKPGESIFQRISFDRSLAS